MSNTKNATNPIDEYLEDSKPSEVEVALCLDRGLRDRYLAADLDLARLLARPALGVTDDEKKESADRLAAEQHAKAEEVEAIGAEIAANETIFLLRNISWTERAVFLGTHPKRDGIDESWDRSTGVPDLVGKCLASITFPGKEPTEITPAQWERFAATLEPEQLEQLGTAAIRLVWRLADPKSVLASETLKTRSGTKSRPRANSRSRTNAS